MSKLPTVRSLMEPGKVEEDISLPVNSVPSRTPFFGFRYSYTEITAMGTTARVKAREMQLEDGVIKSQSFEGTCDRRVYDEFVQQAQKQLLAQTAFFLKAFSWFLPRSK